ncbi:MAG: M20 family metallopeptidase [Rhodothermales bacterium]
MYDAEAQHVLSYLERRKDEMVDLLRRFVMLESPSTDPSAQVELLEVIAAEFERSGFESTRVPRPSSGGYLYAAPLDRRRGRPYQLLLGHCDTVWPAGTIDRMPFRREDGVVRGPGAFDMKGGLVQMIFALRAMAELGLDPDVTPVVLVNSDEEIGSRDSVHAVRRLARHADRAFVLEPALEPVGKLKTSRRGAGKFVIGVRGKSAHSGIEPGAGASAILELSHVIQKLHELNDPAEGISINVGMIDGGSRSNVVAAEASAIVDVRVARSEDAERIVRQIRAITPVVPGTEIVVEGRFGRDPMEPTPRNRALWKRAVRAAEVLGLQIDEGRSGGVSDANVTSRFTATLDGLGSVGDGAHAAHEYVDVGRMPERAALLALLVLQPPLSPEEVEAIDERAAQEVE